MRTVLITTGGTVEPIDGVRGITNFSSGTLGLRIATALLPTCRVVLLRGRKTPALAEHPNLTDISITDTASLQAALLALHQAGRPVDAVVHAMAVSDYTVDAVLDGDSALATLRELERQRPLTTEDVERAFFKMCPAKEGKVSSAIARPFIRLKPTEKLLLKLRDLWPVATLVGFKLLNGVDEVELMTVARASLRKARLDYVVANDLGRIHGEAHRAIVLDDCSVHFTAETKQAIADGLARLLTQ